MRHLGIDVGLVLVVAHVGERPVHARDAGSKIDVARRIEIAAHRGIGLADVNAATGHFEHRRRPERVRPACDHHRVFADLDAARLGSRGQVGAVRPPVAAIVIGDRHIVSV